MEKLILSDKEIYNLKELGHGSEGTVFLYDDLAIKYYNRMQMIAEDIIKAQDELQKAWHDYKYEKEDGINE